MHLSLFNHHFNIAAFRNKEVDSLYFTLALLKFTRGLISVFVPVYLFKLGFPIWQILGFYFLRSFYYLIFNHSLLGVLQKLSDKMMMALGLPFLVIYFLGLNVLSGLSLLFFILPAAEAMNMLLFWVGYHTDFSQVSEGDHVGEEVGARYMITSFTKFFTPFLGGVLISYLNFHYLFLIASLLLIVAIFPLFFFPKRNMLTGLNLKDLWSQVTNSDLFSFNIAAFAYGSEKMVKVIVWSLFLYLVLGGVEKLGGVVSLGLLGGGIMTYVLGKKFDHQTSIRKAFLQNAGAGLSFVWLTKTFLINFAKQLPSAFAHIADNIFRRTYKVGWRRKFYLLAKQAQDPSVFVMGQEMIYHIARVTVLPILAVLAYLLSLDLFFLTSFILAGIISLGYTFASN